MKVVVPDTPRLPIGQRVPLAAEILAAYVAVRRAQRGRPLPETLARLRGVRAQAGSVRDPVYVARRLGRATIRTITLLPGDSRCLVRSLVLTRLLARRGIESRLVLGVTGSEGFEAHAWVELDGTPVLDPGGFERLTDL